MRESRGIFLGVAGALCLIVLPLLAGCVSIAEFRKLEYEVNKLKAGRTGAASGGPGVADLRTEMESLREDVGRLKGRVEEADHHASQALEEARAARQAAARRAANAPGAERPAPPDEAPPKVTASSSKELRAYRNAYDAWRQDQGQVCIDRFREFLQTYPASDHADDAAYWMADCYYKLGNYKIAVLRFDDVVRRYPTSDKAPEALYRQGEGLLRLGATEAAETAFQRVINEYPDSRRAREADRQLEALRAGAAPAPG